MSEASRTTKIVAASTAAAVALALPVVMFFEGTVNRGYVDPVGIVTACTGSTYDMDGTRLTREDIGKPYTTAECTELLHREMLKHAEALSCITRPVSVYAQAATISFAYNVGVGAACNSRYMKKLNAGDPTACAELSRWTIAKGKELPGLVKRRAAERQLCERQP